MEDKFVIKLNETEFHGTDQNSGGYPYPARSVFHATVFDSVEEAATQFEKDIGFVQAAYSAAICKVTLEEWVVGKDAILKHAESEKVEQFLDQLDDDLTDEQIDRVVAKLKARQRKQQRRSERSMDRDE